jgi:hypothetical protein
MRRLRAGERISLRYRFERHGGSTRIKGISVGATLIGFDGLDAEDNPVDTRAAASEGRDPARTSGVRR